ncbi:hypothetical protein [Blastococcus saxobsidens]|uniref:Uncharacterized protein n=1 Tax=Blastococcus saxobsidens (strain DD2) TaxID=1146883 RepID=H6RPS0_BLASD|nr:hypothetical protein [Blastococcus saxobsidens]CCG01489.1 exported protein of unknown function [Blastococcus saxobsidens DD2]
MSTHAPLRSRGSRGRQVLATSGLTAALVVVPGLARAEEPALPGAVPVPVAEVVEEEVADAVGGGALPGTDSTAPGGTEEPAPAPSPEVPPELGAALRQLAAALRLPDECVDGISQSVDLIVGGLIAIPAEFEALVAELRAALQGAAAGGGPEGLPDLAGQLRQILAGAAAPAVVADSSIVEGLELLAETLPACMPTLPAAPPEPPQPPAPPAPAPPAAPAPQPVAQPVVYPGYAPTGADDDGDGDAPAALAGALALLAGAGAAAYRRQWRAVRSTD